MNSVCKDDKLAVVIDGDLIQHISKLARINIDVEDVNKISESMQNILNLAQQMSDVQSTERMPSHVEALKVEDLAQDEVCSEDQKDAFESHFDQFKQGFFQVPSFVSEE